MQDVSADFYLREEPFGGVLYHVRLGKVRFLSEPGFVIVASLAKGLRTEAVVQLLCERYAVLETEEVRRDIAYFQDLLTTDQNWGRKDLGPWSSEVSGLPVLTGPLELHWEVTNRCNLRCVHCYNQSGGIGPEPGLADIEGVVDELRACPLRGVILSGGEPLMRRDLRDIVRLVSQVSEEVVLATNGTLLTSDAVDWLADWVSAVNLSLDVGDAEGFDEFRGVRGSFSRCLTGLRLLIDAGIGVIVQTTLSRLNFRRLEELASLLVQEGVERWVVRLPVWAGRAAQNRSAFLDRRTVVGLEARFQDLRSRYASRFKSLDIGNSFAWSYEEAFLESAPQNCLVSCAAGTIKAALRPDGTLTPCALFGRSDFCSRPVWGGRLLSEWRDSRCFSVMRNIQLREIAPCNRCGALDRCSVGCRAKAFLRGDILSADPDCNYVQPLV